MNGYGCEQIKLHLQKQVQAGLGLWAIVCRPLGWAIRFLNLMVTCPEASQGQRACSSPNAFPTHKQLVMAVEGLAGESKGISLQLMSLSSALWPLSLLHFLDPRDSLIMRRYRGDRGPGSKALSFLTTPLPFGEKELPKVRGDGDCSRRENIICENKKPPSDSTHPEINYLAHEKVDF